MSGQRNSELKTIPRQVGPSDDKPGDEILGLVKRKGFGSKAVTLFFGVAVVGTAMAAQTSKQAEQQAQAVAALQMTEVSWHKGGWNDMMMFDATVQNTGKRDVRDIKVVCDHLSSNHTKAASNAATIYGPFAAGKSKAIRNFDMGSFREQTKGTNCSIVGATLATKRWGRTVR